MLAEFTIYNDPLRPSVTTNLCSVCYRHERFEGKGIGCCSYEPEFCLFDLVFLYLNYPGIYHDLQQNSRIISGFNGIMAEATSGTKQCPYVGVGGCVLPKDALTPLCRLFICREAALFAPSKFEDRFDQYFTSKEYRINQKLNKQLPEDISLTWESLHDFIKNAALEIKKEIASIDRSNPAVEHYSQEIDLTTFGDIPHDPPLSS